MIVKRIDPFITYWTEIYSSRLLPATSNPDCRGTKIHRIQCSCHLPVFHIRVIILPFATVSVYRAEAFSLNFVWSHQFSDFQWLLSAHNFSEEECDKCLGLCAYHQHFAVTVHSSIFSYYPEHLLQKTQENATTRKCINCDAFQLEAARRRVSRSILKLRRLCQGWSRQPVRGCLKQRSTADALCHAVTFTFDLDLELLH